MIKLQSVKNMFQAKHWFISGWKLFKKRPLTWIFMVLIFIILMIIASNFLIGKFLMALSLPVLAGGIFIALDKANRNEPVGLESLFSVFKDKPVLKQLLTVGAIGVAVLMLTMGLQYLTGTDYEIKIENSQVESANDVYKQVEKGSFFTGIITWIWAWALFFGIPLVAIKREAAIPALKQSLIGSLMNIIPLISFVGMTILLTIISILPVGLGLFVFIPVLFATIYFAFTEIFVEARNGQPSELAAGLGAMAQTIAQEEEQSTVYVNREEHKETDLKKAYESIRVFRLIGMALVSIGVIYAAYTFYSLQMGTNTTGEVLSVEVSRSGSSSNSSRSYTPTFSFTDKQGEQHIAPTSYGSSELNYPVGARVKINYNPDDYSTVRISSISSILYLPLFLWFFGGGLLWYSKKAKKNVDENGVPPRKSVFLKPGSNPRDVISELKNSEINSLSDMLEVVSQSQQDSSNKENSNQNTETDEIIELVLPKKLTLDLYDEYMHITMSWFGNKTFKATLFAAFYIGFLLVFFTSDSMSATGHPLAIKLMPWIMPIFGAGLLYFALTTWLNKTHIFVSQNAIEVKHQPLPWVGNKRLETKKIKQLYSKREISSSSSNNRTSVHFSLHVISFDEEDLTLLKVENSTQALFLEQEIEKYLGIKDLRVRGEIGLGT